jgi:hypothetical protein
MYRSLLYGGRVDLDERTYHELWGADVMEADVTWTRATYWEGELTQIPLTNGNGTRDLAGLLVYNHDDADTGHDNWVDLEALDIEGDLPAPILLQMTNNVASQTGVVRVGHNVYSNPGTLVHMLEAEHGLLSPTSASVDASGDTYTTLSWSGTTQTQVERWTLSSDMLDAAAGNPFRALLKTFDIWPYTDVWLQLKLLDSSTVIWEGPEVLLDAAYLADLGAIHLPPGRLHGATGHIALTLGLYARRTTAGSHSATIDYIFLMPLDGYRRLVTTGVGIATTYRLVDDMIAGELYVDDGAGENRYGEFVASGKAIELVPGHDQRLYFIQERTTGTVEITRTLDVTVHYRPRRVTL